MLTARGAGLPRRVGFIFLGSPTYFVGDDMFWGKDRLHFVENLITKGEIATKGLDIIR